MNDRNRRSAAEVMANAARVVKAAVNIVRAAIAGGLHGAAAAAAKELLPTIIKFAVGVLIAIIVIPMFVISAMPNMFFGYETSEKDPQITMREQALSIGGAYLSLEDFEKTQQDAIITGEAAAYENQGVTIDEIRVSSKFDEEDLCWYIAIYSVAFEQDLSKMQPETVQEILQPVYAAAQENAARREMNLSALFSALGELTLSEFMHVNGMSREEISKVNHALRRIANSCA